MSQHELYRGHVDLYNYSAVQSAKSTTRIRIDDCMAWEILFFTTMSGPVGAKTHCCGKYGVSSGPIFVSSVSCSCRN